MKYSEAEITVEQKEKGEMVWLARVAVTSSVGVVHVHARVRTSAPDWDLEEICKQTEALYPPEYRGVKRVRRIRDAALGALETAQRSRI